MPLSQLNLILLIDFFCEMLLFLMFKMIEGFADVVNDFLGWDSLRLATIKVCLFLFGTIYYFFGM